MLSLHLTVQDANLPLLEVKTLTELEIPLHKYNVPTFSPFVKMTSIITILSLVAAEDLHLEQLDVKTTFLHGYLEEEIYMQQPEGYEVKGKEELVWLKTGSKEMVSKI